MAIKKFKEVLENKGYRIDSNDRKIFENGTIESFFGLSSSDCIEFIIYDSNDNQLPQTSYGMVRYIPMTSQNIGDYFMIAEGTLFQRYRFPSEYFIDVERLLREGGYTNGIFKTQITLINKRIGSETGLDKLWISEISPSRTEVRLFPNTKGVEINPELNERFNLFVRHGEFRDDVAKFAIEYIETIKITEIAKVIKNAYGDRWFSKFVNEYKIQSFDIFCTQVYNKFLESVVNEFTGRISDINDINYGKPIAFKPSLSLTKAEVRTKVEKLLIVSISKYLMLPDVKSGFSKKDTLESIDTPEKILQTKTSDLQIDTKSPEVSIAVIKTATQSQKDLIFEKEVTREVQDTNIPNISKARLRREILNNGKYSSDDGVYGNVSSDSGNMRIMNDGFRNNRLRDIDSMEVIQNQQYLL
jgi:hypothetical protein